MTPHPTATAAMQISGTLAQNAELRNKVLDGDGHTVPVICMEVITQGATAMPVRVEWPQPVGTHAEAERLCKRLRRGTTVQVQAPLLGMHLVAANASQVLPLDPLDPADVHASAQDPTPTTGELFS